MTETQSHPTRNVARHEEATKRDGVYIYIHVMWRSLTWNNPPFTDTPLRGHVPAASLASRLQGPFCCVCALPSFGFSPRSLPAHEHMSFESLFNLLYIGYCIIQDRFLSKKIYIQTQNG